MAILGLKTPDTYNGIHIENCKGVEYGYSGNLKVMSKEAFKLLINNLESCSGKADWVKDANWETIGKGLFYADGRA